MWLFTRGYISSPKNEHILDLGAQNDHASSPVFFLSPVAFFFGVQSPVELPQYHSLMSLCKHEYHLVMTNIATENGPFIDWLLVTY